MSHKIKIYIISAGLLLFGFMQLYTVGSNAFLGSNVLAACDPKVDPGGPDCPHPTATGVQDTDCPSGKASADGKSCVPLGNDCTGKETGDACLKKTPIVHYLNIIIIFLSGLVGLVVVTVIIIGGIQYSMAGDNSTAIQAARQKITNGLIALFAFLFLFAFLQWLIPGGL